MVTFVPGFVSPKVNAWNKLQTAEQDRLKASSPDNPEAVKIARRQVDRVESGAGGHDCRRRRPHRSHPQGRRHRSHRHRRRLRRHHADRQGSRQRLDVSGADRGADAPRLQRRGPAEDPRAERAARDARVREGLEAPAGGTRPVCRRLRAGRTHRPRPSRRRSPITITLERTICFGFCPAYKVTLREDGTVTYEGTQHVKVSRQADLEDRSRGGARAREGDAGRRLLRAAERVPRDGHRPSDDLHVADDRRPHEEGEELRRRSARS